MRLMPILLLLLAACGSGDQPGPELLWMPDYSTPEKATETYMRAIETGDLDLAVMATAPDQREQNHRLVGALLAAAREHGVQLKVEAIEGTAHASETLARLDVRLSAVDDEGKPSRFIPPGQTEPRSQGTSVFAFELQPDGTWRYSPAKVTEISAARRQAAGENREQADAPD